MGSGVKQRKYNILIILIFTIISIIVAYFIYKIAQKRINDLTKRNYQEYAMKIKNKVKDSIKNQKEKITSSVLLLTNRSSMRKVQSSNNPDLIKLREFILNLNGYIEGKNIYFQIIYRNGKSFYRSWCNKRGDYLLDIRSDIGEILEYPKTLTTINVDKFGMTFKSIVPIYNNSKLIGVFEIITNFDEVFINLEKQKINSLFLMDKKYNHQLLKNHYLFVDDYLIINSKINAKLLKIVKQKGVKFFLTKKVVIDKENNSLITTKKIFNNSGDVIGYSFISKSLNLLDIKNIYYTKKNMLYLFIIILIIIIAMGYFLIKKNYEREQQKRINEIKRNKKKIKAILDSQPHIIIVTNGKEVKSANPLFFDFFTKDNSLYNFNSSDKSICDFFIKPNFEDNNYILKTKLWLDNILNNPTKISKVALKKDNKIFYFIVKAKEIKEVVFDDRFVVISFIDITAEVVHLQTQAKYQKALLKATQSSYPNAKIALQKATEITAKTLGISKVSVWLYDDEKSQLECINLFSLNDKKHFEGLIHKEINYPKYFDMLKQAKMMILNDAQNHNWSKKFIHDYLIPLDIKSMLDIPIIRQGEVIGVVSSKQTKKIKKWSNEEIEFITTIAHWVALILEIEHRKEAEILVQEKTKQIIQQNRLALMGEMLSMIAHQWRQPLNAISSTSGSIKLKAMRGRLKDDIAIQKAQSITGYVQHLSETIDDFRDFFKPNKEQKKTSYGNIIQSILNIVEVSIKNKNIKMFLELDCNEEFVTYENEIKQVVLNLVKNAEDILVDNRITNPYIKIKTFNLEKNYILEVSDNGGGISNDIIEKIFDPYFSTKTQKDGTGLGLYMSKMIIEEHCGGKLEVFNRDGGATFKVILYEIVKEEVSINNKYHRKLA